MPFWCIQDNECLACTGGCEGYETKRETMRERRAEFWRRVNEIEAKETNMGHCPQEAKQQQSATNIADEAFRNIGAEAMAAATRAQQVLDAIDSWMGSAKPPTFAQKLASLLNENSKEKGSNTPDFVLAEYMTNCLGNFEAAIKAREKFYGVSSRPGSGVGYEGCTITKIDDEHTHAIELNDRQVRTGEMWSVAPGCQQFGN